MKLNIHLLTSVFTIIKLLESFRISLDSANFGFKAAINR